PQLLAWRNASIPCALVTLVGIDGSSPRRVGSQMAVNIHGDYLGAISTGCAEAAIVTEAIGTIKLATNRTVRYGAGSKYIDVVLPCGSGIDIHFDATLSTRTLKHLTTEIAARRRASLTLDLASATAPAQFTRNYDPVPRIIVAGRGVSVDFVARFAHTLEWDVIAASPDQQTLARLTTVARTFHLTQPDDFDPALIDAHSAVVLVFHDHDWEPAILAKCAASPAFYIGALGSRRTHAQRRDLLAMRGVPLAFTDAIHSPVGLDIGAKNPAEIALAIIAEILSKTPAP
ncbi:MAG: XdhC family protein, partial [Hyphomicrobiaceae bacterium]